MQRRVVKREHKDRGDVANIVPPVLIGAMIVQWLQTMHVRERGYCQRGDSFLHIIPGMLRGLLRG